MSNAFAKLQLFRTAASVTRVHTRRMIYKQSVGEHTFGVLALITLVEPSARVELLRAALYHDVPEAITGDMPSPSKNLSGVSQAIALFERTIEQRYGLTEKLTDHEEQVLKFCDIMELAMFSCEEADMGNRYAALMMQRCLKAIEALQLRAVTSEAWDMYVDMKVRCEEFGEGCGASVLHRTEEY